MRVSQLMSHPAHACAITGTLNDAAQLLWEHDIGCIPVVDEARRLVGIVTDRDIAMAAYTQGRSLGEIPIASCMADDVLCVMPDDTIQNAASRMRELRVRRLPVVDAQGVLVGVLSLSDLCQRRWARGVTKGFDDDELLAIVAAVSQPRRVQSATLMPAAPKTKSRKVRMTIRSVGSAPPRASKSPKPS